MMVVIFGSRFTGEIGSKGYNNADCSNYENKQVTENSQNEQED